MADPHQRGTETGRGRATLSDLGTAAPWPPEGRIEKGPLDPNRRERCRTRRSQVVPTTSTGPGPSSAVAPGDGHLLNRPCPNLGTAWEQSPPEYPLKRPISRNQKARRVNHLRVAAQSAKPPSPVQFRAAPPLLNSQ